MNVSLFTEGNLENYQHQPARKTSGGPTSYDWMKEESFSPGLRVESKESKYTRLA